MNDPVSRFISLCTYRPIKHSGKETEAWLSTVLLLLPSRPLPLLLCLLSTIPTLFSPTAVSLHPVCMSHSLVRVTFSVLQDVRR